LLSCPACGAVRHQTDNGPEFVAQAVQDWIAAVAAKTAYIERSSPWENGYVNSFNARLRDELLNGEIFYTLREAQIVAESWRRHISAFAACRRLRWPRSRNGQPLN
jgi:putative transposase